MKGRLKPLGTLLGAPPPGVSRRSFLRTASAAAPAAWLASAGLGCGQGGGDTVGLTMPDDPGLDPTFRLSDVQLGTLRSLVDSLLPEDQDAGGLIAGSAEYMANEWRSAYFVNSREAVQGGLDALEDLARRELGATFSDIDAEARTQLLRAFQSGEQTIRGVNGSRLVEFFLSMTLEGFLSHPVYGGNRNEVGWRMLGIHPCGPQPRRDTLHRDPHDHPSGVVNHERTQFDAIVVGSGAGGGPVAQILEPGRNGGPRRREGPLVYEARFHSR